MGAAASVGAAVSRAFLNVDLDLAAPRQIRALLIALAPHVLFLRRRAASASIELRTQPRSPSEAIVGFGRILGRLPPKARAEWGRCGLRSMNIGLRGRRQAVDLSPAAVAVLARFGASVAVTVSDR